MSLAEEAREAGYMFPYLFDETQEVAKAYHAACTPDFFLFNEDRRLVYRGQFDDSRPRRDRPVTGADLRGAIDAVLEGRPVTDDQRPSVGCSIKWRAGERARVGLADAPTPYSFQIRWNVFEFDHRSPAWSSPWVLPDAPPKAPRGLSDRPLRSRIAPCGSVPV